MSSSAGAGVQPFVRAKQAKEIDRDMALMGLRELAEMGPDMLLDVRLSAAANTATSR